MIISASYKTDIPAFYFKRFLDDLELGYKMVTDSYSNVTKRLDLSPEIVDCICFWTKNPIPAISFLEKKVLENLGYDKYYFQFTFTPYSHKDIEIGFVNKREVIEVFKKLSNLIGKKRIIWRYDPIFFTKDYDLEYHKKWFDYLYMHFKDFTDRLVISFLDYYPKISAWYHDNVIVSKENNLKLIEHISKKASDLKIFTCAEGIDLSLYNINHGACIDKDYIEEVFDIKLNIKQGNLRNNCRCVRSVDIGSYGSCNYGCKYCYAR